MNNAAEPAIVRAGPAGVIRTGTIQVRTDMQVRHRHGTRVMAP